MNVIMNLYRNNKATISAPVKGEVTSSSIAVTGSVAWYKGNATWGVAYKKHSASSWTHKASTPQAIDMTITSLDADTTYDIKLYVKYNNVYQYGSAIEAATDAENPTPAES
jgi:hypothetical protein